MLSKLFKGSNNCNEDNNIAKDNRAGKENVGEPANDTIIEG